MRDFYIAAPFFNSRQVELVANIEDTLLERQRSFWSPRTFGVLVPKATKPDRKQVLESNVAAIKRSLYMLAVLDFLLPIGARMILEGNFPDGLARKDVATIPDTGVCWEMGFAHANAIPILGLTLQEKVNVMLLETTMGIVRNVQELEEFIDHGVQEAVKCRDNMRVF